MLGSVDAVSHCVVAFGTLNNAIRYCQLRMRCQLACLQVADMLRLPFPDGSFDVVIEKGALEVGMAHWCSPVLLTNNTHQVSIFPLSRCPRFNTYLLSMTAGVLHGQSQRMGTHARCSSTLCQGS